MRARRGRALRDARLRAFRDAVRDIVAAEGWFELSLGPEQPDPRPRWFPAPTARA